MRVILPQIIFAGFVLATYFAFSILKKRSWKYKENRLFVLLCIFSAVWSLGFFCVMIQTEPQNAYFWRAIGMIGTFGFLICAQFLVSVLSGMKESYCKIADVFSLTGIVLYFFVIQKDQVTYQLSNIGMTYSFSTTVWNKLYIWYTVVVALNMGIIIVYMIRNPKVQRLRELGRRLFWVELVMVAGMLLDTIFPLFGQPAIPGSTLGQFWGLAAMYYAISFINHSRININNMSEFIYYSLDEVVLVYDSEEKLQILNDVGYDFFGIQREGLEEISIDMLFEHEATEVFSFDGNSHSMDTVCIHNKKDCNLAINKIYDDYRDVIGYIIIVTDLSERMKAMKQLEEAMNEAEYANKAKSIFLANMSHEIRTPMNAIIGFSELLLRMDISEEAQSHVRDIKWSSHNLLGIINDILDISKIESGKMELIMDNYYTATLLDDVVFIIDSQAKKKGLEFEVEVDRKIPRQLYGDRLKLKGVLINILNNAVKYTPKGKVRFEVFTSGEIAETVKLTFRITDTGAGIKTEDLDTLFENFERLDQRFHYGIEGSGLGLAIVKGLVNLMGGEIHVSSEYGAGSVFTVEMEQRVTDRSPMKKEDIKGRTSVGRDRHSGFVIKNTSVLVVDDNPINIKVAQGIFDVYGVQVDIALSGQEAIKLCKKHNYDLIFMDQMMPELDGTQTMNQVRQISGFYEKNGTGKIIVLTANAIKGTREMLLKEGFDEYLGKPIEMKGLEELLQRFVAKENIVFGNSEGMPQLTHDEEIVMLRKRLPELDVDLGISHCGGQWEDYLKILEITYKHGEKQMKELEQLWEARDYKAFGIKVHSLKSTSLNIGAREISEEARRQEEAVQKENYKYVDENIAQLIADNRILLQKIEHVLIHYQLIQKEAVTEKTMLKESVVRQMLRNIDRLIDKFDFAQVFEVLEEAKKYRMPQEYEEIFGQIEEWMEELQVEQVKQVIKEIPNL